MCPRPSTHRFAALRVLAGLSLLAIAGCDQLPTEPAPAGPQAAPQRPAQTANVLDPTASLLTLAVIDPAGDETGAIDVASMQMDFDPATGEYTIRLRSHPAGPFVGTFRVNINLFDIDDVSVFGDVFNDYTLTESTTDLELSGASSALTGWAAGDHIETNSLCNLGPNPGFSCSTYSVPNPAGTSLFRSSVGWGGFLTNEDVIAFADHARTAVVDVLTPSLRVSRIAADVEWLADAEILTDDQADGLQDKLTQVLAKLEAGREQPAINQLQAFVHQVEGLVPAQISEEAAQMLMDQVADVLAQLGA